MLQVESVIADTILWHFQGVKGYVALCETVYQHFPGNLPSIR